MFHGMGTIRVDTNLIIFMPRTGSKNAPVAKSTRRLVCKLKKPTRGGWDKFRKMFLNRFVKIFQRKQKVSPKPKRKAASCDSSLVQQQAVAKLWEVWNNSKRNKKIDEAKHTAKTWIQSQTKPNKTDTRSQFAPYVWPWSVCQSPHLYTLHDFVYLSIMGFGFLVLSDVSY